MNRPISPFLFALAAVALFLVLWAGTTALVYWDTRRRGLSGLARWACIGLPAFFPLVGFLAYWTGWFIYRFLGSIPSGAPQANQRFTQEMRVQPRQVPRTTIPAADTIKGTIPVAAVGRPDMRVQPARARQAYRAVIIAGPRTGDGFLLSQLPAVIGRSAAANIFLAADMSISRQHAEIYDEQGTLRIRDLNSTHGTLVNGFSIQDKSLDPGDRIQIGATVLLIQEAGG
jgi:hypothetical protein